MHNNNGKSGLGLEITGFSEATMGELPEPTGDVGFDNAEEVFERLAALLERAEDIERRVNHHFVEEGQDDSEQLVSTVLQLSDDVLALMHRLTNHAEHPLTGAQTYDDARYAIEMAINELARQHDVLADCAMREHNVQRDLAAAAKAKGVVTKAVVNVEYALCEGTDFEPRLEAYLRLEDSLETRRAYGKMRRALFQFGRVEDIPPHDEVVARLRRAGTSFVHLRGHDCFSMLRVEDRFQFEDLWDRIYQWLRSDTRDEETYAGWLIWQDVLNFIELLGSINFRQELREHDMALADRVLDSMSELEDEESVGDALAGELHSLTGFSPQIDSLIEKGADAEVGSWRRQLLSIKKGV
ncbi:MAG: hypothetical protein ACQEVA_09335 [Myxococcota bacterium]